MLIQYTVPEIGNEGFCGHHDFGVKSATLLADKPARNTSPANKFFFAWLKPLHDLDLLCLPDLINPWDLHIFAVIIRRGNPLKHIERRTGGGAKPGK